MRCNACSWRRARGFTLIELLVVIGIISLLMALLLPAVQKIREAAARAQCTNNLKQVGLALHNYHDSAGSLPPGYASAFDGNGSDTGPGWGWAAFLLPYVEQEPLFRSVQFDQPIESAVNAGARLTSLKVYLCPADNPPPTFTALKRDLLGNPLGPICDVASANYVGVFGHSEPGVDGEGVFSRNSRIAMRDVTDGTSQTLMVGERAHDLGPATWVGAVTNASLFPPPNSVAPPVPYNSSGFVLGHTGEQYGGAAVPTEVNHFSAHHGRGGNFVFVDGHVQFLGSSVSYAVYVALSTRAGGEPVDGGF